METPRFIARDAFERLRGAREFAWNGEGLWCCGVIDALARPCVAIVGTRAATPYGRRLAGCFARDLAHAGCTIVSGLALGIDAAAHAAALEADAATIGVLGGGHERFFPRRNRELAERMIQRGAVLSPYPPQRETYPYQFLERNGIVAALADAVLVIEAPARSGALNTAGWAAGSIPVFAVPGDVDRASFAGSHALLRDGATLARSAADVLEGLRIDARFDARPEVERDGVEGTILRLLANGERPLDDLIDATGLATADLLATLAMLELEGLVERRGATRFGRLIQ
ncbi:MAG TPA: DNA-processing protein DprA [Candidatus Baltobacteraceae bacterium]|nr:DNA-processing protein DprA [Candidatus Baltobacteraceae bacterium]